jgi:CheY-like chemotaxis protein
MPPALKVRGVPSAKWSNFDQTGTGTECDTLRITMATPAQRQVLVVDDDPTIRTCLTQLLESVGYDVATAVDGVEALLSINESAPDIIISDLNMPGMSGVDLLSEIRRHFPRIVTIAMSGAYRNGGELPSEVMAHGFYPKGEPPSNLYGTLAQLLEGIRSPKA